MSEPEGYADLHLHTHYSDGADPPATVVERARALGFAGIAITDHDTVAGINEAAAAAADSKMAFLPGVEISATYGQIEIHVVGLGIHPGDAVLLEALHTVQEARQHRADRIIGRLNTLGVTITRDEVERVAGGASALGRMHIARALHERGDSKTVQDAFFRYIGRTGKAFIPKRSLSCNKAIDLIHSAGGVAILGHPGVGTTVRHILARLFTLPFDGIEAYHSQHTPGEVTQYLEIARERQLLVSGGSDCHGVKEDGSFEMGKVRIPMRYFEGIQAALRA